MKPFERRKSLLNHLYLNNVVYVNKLASEFNVSEETIRRDLEKLEKEGIVERNYGGAKLIKTEELPYSVRHTRNKDSKVIIAKKIDQFIQNDTSLFADSSSTINEALKRFAISNKRIHIITNAVNALYELNQTSMEINSTGGKLLKHSSALVGPQTTESINKFHTDYAILSCKALSKDGIITDSNEYESHIKELMINKAKQVILAIDVSKFDGNSLISFGHLSNIDYIVTDTEFDDEWKSILENHSVKII
ncbi:MAG: DeoR/GlpR family DNA-binding transcription regulator [Staphylococcus equorum]|uniref:DeoR/GlpR family DNA-binding transcription regulator n=1 Tax=Staphylococcus TaxID=1279 RepID=UPI000852ACEE|nr:DeoR/GlpR family DNA-binding transcription regulator [Staphylococcus equorum]MDG0823223.1 DeoR/GlpR family DNA-binding transcription regulator [Staphylococcus equorum]MDG0836954.1 DeoR/GlpR family DNA-binding transcription regulator [Staphylococcus equorum]MDK9871547.1 DeoR/GlpR family DNA-binding transcription regulator [Staphylococcus equorum]MDK9877884.1 DeoR/GlpR family DNA-binding transcription regulator [Staphylococcus equorum]MDN5809779.1 DeoR/GlpR family DNA-binding transcription re